MSFPHRTAFYDREESELIEPQEANERNIYTKNLGDCFELDLVSRGPGRFKYEAFEGGRYIPLAFTGLKDTEGFKIFEGHIRKLSYDSIPLIMKYENGSFKWCGNNIKKDHKDLDKYYMSKYHVLTDQEMVPDWFDVNEYFELEEYDVN